MTKKSQAQERGVRLMVTVTVEEDSRMEEIRQAYGLSKAAQMRMLIARQLEREFPVERRDGGLFVKTSA